MDCRCSLLQTVSPASAGRPEPCAPGLSGPQYCALEYFVERHPRQFSRGMEVCRRAGCLSERIFSEGFFNPLQGHRSKNGFCDWEKNSSPFREEIPDECNRFASARARKIIVCPFNFNY